MIIALHGLQGSAKSTISDYLKQKHPEYFFLAVKDSFVKYVDYIINDLIQINNIDSSIEFHKSLSLAISTTCEEYYHKDVWSNMTYDMIIAKSGHCVVDGVRTKMNLNMLQRFADSGEQVYFLKLVASEEVRKQRVSVWRDNGGYTEVLLEKPDDLLPNFHWVEINTELSKEQVFAAVEEALKKGYI